MVAPGGGPMLYVLRSLPGGGYTFIGDAYIHGLMDGEAFKEKNELGEKFILT